MIQGNWRTLATSRVIEEVLNNLSKLTHLMYLNDKNRKDPGAWEMEATEAHGTSLHHTLSFQDRKCHPTGAKPKCAPV